MTHLYTFKVIFCSISKFNTSFLVKIIFYNTTYTEFFFVYPVLVLD